MNKKILIVAILTIMLAMTVPVFAIYQEVETNTSIPMTGTFVQGTGSPPEIKAKWELVDEDPIEPLTQVYPVLGDNPLPKWMKGYVVARDNQGRDTINGIYLEVYHPDDVYPFCGDHKFQVGHVYDDGRETGTPCVKLDTGHNDPVTGLFVPGPDYAEMIDSIDDAVEAGYITGPRTTSGTEAWELVEEITNWEDAWMWRCEWPMSYHQPCGWYTVEAWGVDRNGEHTYPKFTNEFEFVCTPAVKIDFNTLAFTELEPDKETMIYGDWDMTTHNHPSMKNWGNTEIKTGLRASKMFGTPGPQQKYIEDFDAKFWGFNPDDQTWSDQKLIFKASNNVWFDKDHILPLCNTTKISFSVHPTAITPIDTYTGNMTLYIEGGFFADTICPTEP